MNKNILLIYGGMEEATISSVSAEFIQKQLLSINNINIIPCQITKNNQIFLNTTFEITPNTGTIVKLERGGVRINDGFHEITLCIPCIHGSPGESGEIQDILNYFSIPYLGNLSETFLRYVLTK